MVKLWPCHSSQGELRWEEQRESPSLPGDKQRRLHVAQELLYPCPKEHSTGFALVSVSIELTVVIYVELKSSPVESLERQTVSRDLVR